MRTLNINQIADGAAVAATTNYGPFIATTHRVTAVQAVWTASTASFTAKLQLSVDGSTWEDFTTATTITDANGAVIWHVDTKDVPYWRVVVTRTSGTLTTFKAYVAHIAR